MTTWRDSAACLNSDPDLFFSERTDRGVYRKALAICAECAVRDDCLDWALKERIDSGVFGGTTPEERSTIRRRKYPRRPLKACGTLAAYVRHIKANQKPCEPCREAKRAYTAKRREAA